MPQARPPKLRAPTAPPRSRRAPAAVGIALLAIGLATEVASPEARADMLFDYQKKIEATYELTGIDEHPGYIFVAFPYGGCPSEPIEEYYKLNPHNDYAWTNYEVLLPGRSYKPMRICHTKVYAFKASDFVTEERVLTRGLDWNRPVGYKVTIIKGFDELKESEKFKFVEQSRSVSPSTVNVNFPSIVDKEVPYDSTHDILRVESVTADAARIVGVRVRVTTGGKDPKEILYWDGYRPKEVGEMFAREPVENPVPDSVGKALCAALVSIGLIGLGLSLRGRSEPKKREDLSAR